MTSDPCFYFYRVPLHVVIARLEAGESLEDVQITLFPPEDGNLTGEESGDEIEADLNHLPRQVLMSEVEVKEAENEETENLDDPSQEVNKTSLLLEGNVSDLEKEAIPKKRGRKRKDEQNLGNEREKKKAKVSEKPHIHHSEITWIDDEAKFTKRAANADNVERFFGVQNLELSCVTWFEKLFSEDIVSLVCQQSNLYAMQRNHNLNLSNTEVKVYTAILMLTGYLTPKYMRMLWETQSDTHNSLVSSSMRRNRFFEIQQYLHLADNSKLDLNDKFCKIRGYLTLLSNNFTSNYSYIGSSHVSVDETMVPYYGKHSAKQHIHGKPLKFGYKLWSIATRLGYLISFEPYQGSKNAKLPFQEEYGLGAAVVLELVSRLPPESGPYNVYFDRFFSSLKLFHVLNEKNIGGTGTILDNRTGKCPLEETKRMHKKPRGTMSSLYKEDVAISKWNDNNIVTVISNCHGVQPVTKVDRIGTIDKKKTKIKVDCPNIIKQYNYFMGGVDRFDENLDSLRVAYRGRKWWFPLFVFGLDAACHNAWRLKRHTEPEIKMSYVEFRRSIVQNYCRNYGKAPERSYVVNHVPSKKQGSETTVSQHKAESCEKHMTCKHCKKRTRKICKQCNVPLHVHCFFDFHASL